MMAWALFALGVAAGPFLEPQCDAALIARHAPTMTKAQSLEVIDVVEEMGGITSEHANQYRQLIEEAYQVTDVQEWSRARCAQQES